MSIKTIRENMRGYDKGCVLSNNNSQYHFTTNTGQQKSNKNILTNKMDFSKVIKDVLWQNSGLIALK